jgi:hypothetical protein
MKNLQITFFQKVKHTSSRIGKGLCSYSFTLFINAGLLLISITSCTETGQENINIELNKLESNSEINSKNYEEKLKALTIFFGEVMRDPEALEELYSFAKVQGPAHDINFNLKKLFNDEFKSQSRKQSAIVSAFKNKAVENSHLNQKYTTDEFINFILENDISVLAPYLVDDFSINEIDEVTVSWWTQEFETENLAINKDWKGATKAVKIKLYNLNEVNSNPNETEYFLADDEWAIANPTIVLGAFDNEDENIISEVENKNLNQGAKIASEPITLCGTDDRSSQNLVVRMPAFRLDENIRAWPNPNRIYFWVANGDFVLGSNGLPTISASVNMPFADFEVTRHEANIKRWKVTPVSFIISSWKPESSNMYLVWGCTKTNVQIDVTGSLKGSKDGLTAEASVKVALRNSVELESALSFDKCFTIKNNVNSINQGFGFYGTTSYPVYAFNRIRTYFTLELI